MHFPIVAKLFATTFGLVSLSGISTYGVFAANPDLIRNHSSLYVVAKNLNFQNAINNTTSSKDLTCKFASADETFPCRIKEIDNYIKQWNNFAWMQNLVQDEEKWSNTINIPHSKIVVLKINYKFKNKKEKLLDDNIEIITEEKHSSKTTQKYSFKPLSATYGYYHQVLFHLGMEGTTTKAIGKTKYFYVQAYKPEKNDQLTEYKLNNQPYSYYWEWATRPWERSDLKHCPPTKGSELKILDPSTKHQVNKIEYDKNYLIEFEHEVHVDEYFRTHCKLHYSPKNDQKQAITFHNVNSVIYDSQINFVFDPNNWAWDLNN